jgi:FtsP/CotA-like multicopper oxidase with cupredoxin domain
MLVLALLMSLPAAFGPIGSSAGAAPLSKCHRKAPPIIKDGFPEPKRIYSRGGRLDLKLRSAIGPTTINGERVRAASTYNGQYPGPTLMICSGDRLKVHFVNDLTEPTNLHTHGFHVSPSGNHDNVYLDLKPGSSFNYVYDIPRSNPPGDYWYHPHRHMYVEPQIFAGLAGAIIQEGGIDRLPALRKVPQRTMVITSTEVKDGKVIPVDDTVEADTPLHVNGWINPRVKIRPGQIQRWHIFNANDNRIVVLRLAGHSFRVIGKDGDALGRPIKVRDLTIGPGQRRQVLVRGGPPGTYVMRALPFAQFPGGDKAKNGGPTPNQHVITMRSAGRPAHDRFPGRLLPTREDLRKVAVDRRRTVIFDEREVSKNNFDFTLNGQVFDPNRVMTMKLNAVEQWKLVNRNDEWHTFHIHVNDFQVISVGGRKRRYVDYEDNLLLPPNSSSIIRTRPTGFTGKFVFHCHITFHEDHGMMAAVQVLRNPSPSQLAADVTRKDALTIASSAYGSETAPDPSIEPIAWSGPAPPAKDTIWSHGIPVAGPSDSGSGIPAGSEPRLFCRLGTLST